MRIDEAKQRGDAFLFVFCDDDLHAGRRVAVTNFVKAPDGTWHEVPASRAGARVGTGYHLLDDRPARPGWALDPDVHIGDARDRHSLRCRKCKHQRPPVPLKPETRDRVCEFWRALGVSEVSLAQVAATVSSSIEH